MFVGPAVHVCGPSSTCLWAQQYMFVGPAVHVCGPSSTCLWAQQYMFVGPAVQQILRICIIMLLVPLETTAIKAIIMEGRHQSSGRAAAAA
jgi:hypothetical protein